MVSDAFVVAGNKVSGVQPRGRTDGLVSVLISCCGQLEYTRLCVPSLLRYSRQPYELVFLDSDSLDGTSEYLDGVAAAAPVRVEVVRVPAEPPMAAERGGHSAGRKEDVVSIRGEFVALVNNDTIVSQGWLEGLLSLACSAVEIGMVAPMSNQAPAGLLVDPVPYEIDDGLGHDTAALGGSGEQAIGRGGTDRNVRATANPWPQIDKVNRFAHGWQEQGQGQWFEADSLGGGCVLLKREVLQKLGLFPSRTPLGTFDTEGLSQRVRQAGYRLAGSRQVFIHNFASRGAG